MKKNKNGFTLIELIVVIAIVGLLTAVTLVSLATARQRGSDTSKIRAVAEVRSALGLYFSEHGTFPAGTGVTALNALVSEKFITSVDSNILYQSTSLTNIACGSSCPSYHLAIVLARTDNKVLYSDKDINDTGAINGTTNTCVTGGSVPTPPTPDLCYDITP